MHSGSLKHNPWLETEKVLLTKVLGSTILPCSLSTGFTLAFLLLNSSRVILMVLTEGWLTQVTSLGLGVCREMLFLDFNSLSHSLLKSKKV